MAHQFLIAVARLPVQAARIKTRLRFLAALLLLAFCTVSQAADAIPATHVGTWRRIEVLDTKTGQGQKAGRRYFMIMKPDGHVLWTGTQGAPDHSPMQITIRNGSEMFEKTFTGEKPLGRATIEGDRLKMIFSPVPRQAASVYVRHSRSIDPKDVAGVKP